MSNVKRFTNIRKDKRNMKFSQEEVELTLNMYSIAKKHLNDMERKMIFEDNSKMEIAQKSNYVHYAFIIHTVDSWLKYLLPDEVEIIIMRIKRKKTFDYISIQLGYANHSSVYRKYRDIIKKLSHIRVVDE